MRRRGDLFGPAVVLAGRQTAGRGRGTHSWWSGAGCLTVTFVLPVDEQVAPHQLPLLAGLAVRAAAAELTGDADIQLKWPNDLLFDFRKLAGLLCERIEGVDLIGLGLNVNLDPRAAPLALRDRVTSLSQISGRPFDMTTTLATIARSLHRILSRQSEQPFAQWLREYDAHHALVGRKISVVGADDAPLLGRCQGLDPMGRLLLRTGRIMHHIIAGQVVLM